MMNTLMVHAPGVIAAYGGSAEEMVSRRDEQCPMGRLGDAWDVAYAALFFASDEAKYECLDLQFKGICPPRTHRLRLYPLC
jgi:NAD(P)-dependent dehydrogenase (short-subunit alcohol dehydrogenase family)